jgi:hypothetical protein
LESDITLSDKNGMLYLHVVRSSHFDGSFFLYFLQSFFFTIHVLASKATCQYSRQALSSSDFGQNLIFIAHIGHNLPFHSEKGQSLPLGLAFNSAFVHTNNILNQLLSQSGINPGNILISLKSGTNIL